MSEQTINRCREIAADLSGMEPSDLSPEASFLSLGFDSLFLTQLAAAYTREFGQKVTFRQLIDEAPTMTALAAILPAPRISEPVAEVPQPAVQSLARPVSKPVEIGGLAGVFQQQLVLMQEQLRLLTEEEPVCAETESRQPASSTPVEIEEVAEEPALPKGFGPSLVEGKGLTPAQQAHLDRLIDQHNEKTKGSKSATQTDRAHHADPRTAAGFDKRWKELVYPLVIQRSEGAYLWDVDGNRYIDMLNGFGPNFFGHNAPFVREALRGQLDSGFELGPQTPRAGEAAKLLCELTGMDRASWVNTGSEAVQAAIRIARTVTTKNKIVVFEGAYHGNFDEVLVRRTGKDLGRTIPMAPGIPLESVGNVIVLPYGEDQSLDLIRENADEIAAVLVEPIQSRRPELQPREFLHQLRALTKQEDIVLVFDEVITGFRTGPGGAQAYFGVEADLATYGKVLGGGMPVGAVAGRKGIMDTFDGGFWQYGDDTVPDAGVTFFAGTFVRHPLAMAAVHASLSYLKAAGPALQQGINQKAERFEKGLNGLFKRLGVPFHLVRFGSQMFLRTSDAGPLASIFFYHLRDRGVHLLEGFPCYMTAAHTDQDVDYVIAAFEESLIEMIGDGVIEGRAPLRDLTYTPTPVQMEIWIASQLDPEAHLAFNESDTFIFEGADYERLEKAIRQATKDIEAFKTTFDGDGSVARVHAGMQIAPTPHDHRTRPMDELLAARETFLAAQSKQAFDLENGPLVRLSLIRETDTRTVFIIFAHHLVFDGWSAEALLDNIAAAYRGDDLTEIHPFSHYTVNTGAVDDLLWWKENWKEGTPSLVRWSTEAAEPQMITDAATLSWPVNAALTLAAKELVTKCSVSPSTIWLSAYAISLGKLTGMDDIIIGVPAAGQVLNDIPAIGCAVHLLPVRMKLDLAQSFFAFVKQVQSDVAVAAEHPAVSLGGLARELNARTALGRPPIIQAVFNFRAPFTGVDMEEVKVSALENPRKHLFYELFLNLTAHPQDCVFDAEYRTALLDDAEAGKILQAMCAIVEVASSTPDIKLSELPALSGSSVSAAHQAE